MPTYLIFPESYDPTVASGPPTDDYARLGITWTEDDTNRMIEMERQARKVTCSPEYLPKGRWITEVED